MIDEPNFTARPPHIDPRKWYAAPWSARKKAIDDWNRANRPADDRTMRPPAAPEVEAAVASSVTVAERVAAVELCLEAGWTPEQIVEEMCLKPKTIVVYLEREGRHELKAGFNRLASRERRAAA